MSDLDEQLKRGELAGQQVQAMLANERRLSLEIERLTARCVNSDGIVAELEIEIERLTALNAELLAALEFYANPETYRALLLAADPPCGDFIRDFSVVEGAYTDRPMPGKRARTAIAKVEGK